MNNEIDRFAHHPQRKDGRTAIDQLLKCSSATWITRTSRWLYVSRETVPATQRDVSSLGWQKDSHIDRSVISNARCVNCVNSTLPSWRVVIADPATNGQH